LSLIESGLPAGVVNMVLGGGVEVGTPLTESDIDGVSFTGSCAVGQQIESRCSARGVRTITELGGKNVAVVCADADLDAAVEAIVNGAFRFAGQKCTATSRVVVLESVQAEFISRLMSRMRDISVGLPSDPTTFMGPLISQGAVADALTYVDDAVAVGAELLSGGKRADIVGSSEGAFLEPTVLAGVTAGMRIATEELFAPVLVIITARDTEEAFALADRTDFGLTAAIFTNNLATAFAFIDNADVGAVQVNLPTAGLEYQAPVGGRRGSGSGGVEQGIAALDIYTRTKSVSMRYRTSS
jgi:aldehyde dehydrogenase (NAD+)